MKKRIVALLLVLMYTVSMFAGCQNNSGETTPTTPAVEYMKIAENKTTEYKIVSLITDKAIISDLATDLLIKTGAKFEVVNEANAGPKAIYIGTVAQMAGKGGTSTELTYTTYEIKVDNGNIYVSVADETLIDKAVEKLKEAIVKTADGVFGIDQNLSGMKNLANITEVVPVFETASGKNRELYDAGSGNYQITYQALNLSAADAEVAAYEQSLVDAGYSLHQKNTINQSQFFTYTKGDTLVHCNYFKPMKEFRIVYGPKTYLGSQTPITEYEKKVTPSMSIVALTDSGLSMVYQAHDGSFVIIDGGYGTDTIASYTINKGTSTEMTLTYNRDVKTDMESLWKLLEEKTPAGEKPQVTWMITHADPDHIGLPTLFIKDYKDKFDLNLVCYNFPDLDNVGLENGSITTFEGYMDAFISSVNSNFPNANHMIYHTGQKLYLPGAEIEFLFTAEDYWPNKMPWMNHTSGAWRITSEGKTIMITGDCETGLNNQMVKVFGSYLKSDIMQLNHHGSNGGTLAFYKQVNPTVALWACPQKILELDNRRLGTQAGYDFNLFIQQNAKDHYSHTETHTILLPSLEEEK